MFSSHCNFKQKIRNTTNTWQQQKKEHGRDIHFSSHSFFFRLHANACALTRSLKSSLIQYAWKALLAQSMHSGVFGQTVHISEQEGRVSPQLPRLPKRGRSPRTESVACVTVWVREDSLNVLFESLSYAKTRVKSEKSGTPPLPGKPQQNHWAVTWTLTFGASLGAYHPRPAAIFLLESLSISTWACVEPQRPNFIESGGFVSAYISTDRYPFFNLNGGRSAIGVSFRNKAYRWVQRALFKTFFWRQLSSPWRKDEVGWRCDKPLSPSAVKYNKDCNSKSTRDKDRHWNVCIFYL